MVDIFIAVMVVGVVLLLLLAVLGPGFMVRRSLRGAHLEPVDRITAENELRKLILEAAAAVVLIAGAYWTYSELRVTREQLVLNQAQLRTTQTAQLTDRFTRTIEQIASDDATVQIGGIYGLEGVARTDTSYYPILDEVLAALIRQHAPCVTFERPCSTDPNPRPDSAVQTAVKVLGRVPQIRDRVLDLSNVDLRGVDLSNANLAKASLQGSNLSYANISGADLRGADLRGAKLHQTHGVSETRDDGDTRWP